MGLVRVFLTAGSPTTVASLWAVDDAAACYRREETILPQHSRGLFRATDLRSKVQVREDERVVNGGTHPFGSSRRMLRDDENCT